MARFFIDRPIFAWVIAIIIMIAGGLALTQLPISMYPNIAPPSWPMVTCAFWARTAAITSSTASP